MVSDLNFGPVSSEHVDNVEKELDIKLSRSYRAYLLGFGGGMMLNYEFCGIPTEKCLIPPAPNQLGLPDTTEYAIVSMVDVNKKMRKDYPLGHLYICSDGGDFHFFLDTGSMSDHDECPVLMYGPGSDGKRVASTFIHFLEKLADEISL